ncbi:hypothetical protein M758_12G117000 [Ceratodon purpureus]|nr:hypothetical protein M758_12G117000 [Ceratodon purpureus]
MQFGISMKDHQARGNVFLPAKYYRLLVQDGSYTSDSIGLSMFKLGMYSYDWKVMRLGSAMVFFDNVSTTSVKGIVCPSETQGY